MESKVCAKCGVEKSLDEFPKAKRGLLGRRSDCKICHAKVAAASQARAYAANKEKVLARNAAWRKANPEKVRESDARKAARRKAENPERVRLLAAERMRRFRQRNPVERKRVSLTPEQRRLAAIKNAKRWAAANADRVKEIQQKWRTENPDRLKELSNKANKQWRTKHPERWAEIQTSRKRAKQSSPKWGDRKRMQVVYAKAKEWRMEVDHVVPLNHPLVSGLHVWWNLQLLSRADNRRKNNRTWPDMP